MEALEMDCAFGTFWSNEANTCDTASDVICEKGKYFEYLKKKEKSKPGELKMNISISICFRQTN